MADPRYQEVWERAKVLREDLSRCAFFAGTDAGRRFDALKDEALRLLDGKLLPELQTSLDLPLFVAVLGGTNTGKSTAFNALAGVILSEVKVTAGATKHPLMYVHRRWEETLLRGGLFGRLECRPLRSPAETILAAPTPRMFFSFHDRKELETIAFIDSPDFDSTEPKNRDVAHLVLTQADVCLFLTTPQKYKDRVLMEDLDEIARQRKKAAVLFNLVDDEMLYRTMVCDMRARMDAAIEVAGYLPTVDARHPERKLQERVSGLVTELLDGVSREEVKRRVMGEALSALVARVRELVQGYEAEASYKDRVLQEIRRQRQEALSAYRDGFSLLFPELAEALRRRLRSFEVAQLFGGRPGAASSLRRRGLFGFFVHGLEVAGESAGRLIVQSLDPEPAPRSWEAVRTARDQQDLTRVLQLAQLLRARIDQALRQEAASSALCLSLLREFFTVQSLERFEPELREQHQAARERAPCVGEALLARVPEEPEPGLRPLPVACNLLKLASGVAFAIATDGLGFWDLLFLPLGAVVGGYVVALCLFGLYRHQRARFAEQRLSWFRSALDRALLGPLREKVENVASEQDLRTLAAHAEAVAQAKP